MAAKYADDFVISKTTMNWILSGKANVFYAWHYGNVPTVKNMQAISGKWNIPTLLQKRSANSLGC